jgi:hypothetical protein
MNEKNKKLIGTREKENALLDFVNYQAQEAILNPNLPDTKKDEILDDAIGTIRVVAERKAVYYAKYGEGRRIRRSHVIYEASDPEYEERENIPSIIKGLNEHLQKDAPKDMKEFTIEEIAERTRISKNILYEWVTSDTEFISSLERLKDVQENDPFKTGTSEDFFVNSMMIALLLIETRDRHFKPGDI